MTTSTGFIATTTSAATFYDDHHKVLTPGACEKCAPGLNQSALQLIQQVAQSTWFRQTFENKIFQPNETHATITLRLEPTRVTVIQNGPTGRTETTSAWLPTDQALYKSLHDSFNQMQSTYRDCLRDHRHTSLIDATPVRTQARDSQPQTIPRNRQQTDPKQNETDQTQQSHTQIHALKTSSNTHTSSHIEEQTTRQVNQQSEPERCQAQIGREEHEKTIAQLTRQLRLIQLQYEEIEQRLALAQSEENDSSVIIENNDPSVFLVQDLVKQKDKTKAEFELNKKALLSYMQQLQLIQLEYKEIQQRLTLAPIAEAAMDEMREEFKVNRQEPLRLQQLEQEEARQSFTEEHKPNSALGTLFLSTREFLSNNTPARNLAAHDSPARPSSNQESFPRTVARTRQNDMHPNFNTTQVVLPARHRNIFESKSFHQSNATRATMTLRIQPNYVTAILNSHTYTTTNTNPYVLNAGQMLFKFLKDVVKRMPSPYGDCLLTPQRLPLQDRPLVSTGDYFREKLSARNDSSDSPSPNRERDPLTVPRTRQIDTNNNMYANSAPKQKELTKKQQSPAHTQPLDPHAQHTRNAVEGKHISYRDTRTANLIQQRGREHLMCEEECTRITRYRENMPQINNLMQMYEKYNETALRGAIVSEEQKALDQLMQQRALEHTEAVSRLSFALNAEQNTLSHATEQYKKMIQQAILEKAQIESAAITAIGEARQTLKAHGEALPTLPQQLKQEQAPRRPISLESHDYLDLNNACLTNTHTYRGQKMPSQDISLIDAIPNADNSAARALQTKDTQDQDSAPHTVAYDCDEPDEHPRTQTYKRGEALGASYK